MSDDVDKNSEQEKHVDTSSTACDTHAKGVPQCGIVDGRQVWIYPDGTPLEDMHTTTQPSEK